MPGGIRAACCGTGTGCTVSMLDPPAFPAIDIRQGPTLAGERPASDLANGARRHRRKRGAGEVWRTIPPPPGVDDTGAEARFKNGVPTIRLPQTPEARTKVRRIEIAGGGSFPPGHGLRSRRTSP